MSQKGPHTWDMVLDYQRCPACGFVQETRVPYLFDKKTGNYLKSLDCERCSHTYQAVKPSKLKRRPLISEGEPAEITWG